MLSPATQLDQQRQLLVQLEQSRETLRKASGQSVQHIAYPYGVINATAFPHLSKAGYKTAFQLQTKKLDRTAPLYTLRRSLVESTWSGDALLPRLKGQHS